MSAKVIILNGVSSAGKSSLARALQQQASGSLLHIEMDKFISFLPDGHELKSDWFKVDYATTDGVKLPSISNGPRGSLLLEAMRNFVIEAGRKGLDCVVDEVCHAAEIEKYRRGLDGCDVRFVKVSAPIEVIEKREKDRGDRLIGLAREQSGHLHVGIAYDTQIDTSAENARELARRLLAELYL